MRKLIIGLVASMTLSAGLVACNSNGCASASEMVLTAPVFDRGGSGGGSPSYSGSRGGSSSGGGSFGGGSRNSGSSSGRSSGGSPSFSGSRPKSAPSYSGARSYDSVKANPPSKVGSSYSYTRNGTTNVYVYHVRSYYGPGTFLDPNDPYDPRNYTNPYSTLWYHHHVAYAAGC